MYCTVPYAICELKKIENWLNEKAAEGKVLEKWTGLFVKFSKKEETGFCYRLDADDMKNEANWERKNELSEAGWEYVCTLGGNGYIHAYRAPEGTPDFPEDEKLKKTAVREYRRGSWGFLLCSFLYILLLGLSFYSWWKWPLTELLAANAREVLVYPGILILAILSFGGDACRMIKTSKRLSSGWRMTETERETERKPRYSYGMWEIFVITALAALLICFFWFRKEKYINFGEVYPPVPAVDLRAIETEDDFQMESFSMNEHKGINMADRMEMKKNILNGVFYETDQYGTYESGNDRILPYLSGQYYKIKGNFLADSLLDQLIVRYTEYDGRANRPTKKVWNKKELKEPGFLKLVTAEEVADHTGETAAGAPLKRIFARTEKYVICLHYTGNADMEQLLRALSESFSQ